MNIYQIPLLTYLVSSVVLIYLFFKKSKSIFIPQISQTGVKNISIYSYWIYFSSFIIIGGITGLFYINEIHIKDKPYLTKLIIVLGLTGCILNMIQGYVSLDKEEYNKYMKKSIGFAWLSIIFLFPLFMGRTFYYLKRSKSKNKNLFSNIYFSLGSISQRGCVFFLLLALFIYGYYGVGNSKNKFIF